jgi:hypothetical protein
VLSTALVLAFIVLYIARAWTWVPLCSWPLVSLLSHRSVYERGNHMLLYEFGFLAQR